MKTSTLIRYDRRGHPATHIPGGACGYGTLCGDCTSVLDADRIDGTAADVDCRACLRQAEEVLRVIPNMATWKRLAKPPEGI